MFVLTVTVLPIFVLIFGVDAAPTSAAAVVDDCFDRKDCSGFDVHDSCCGQYEAYSRYNCAKHCSFCKPKVTVAPLCTDTIPNCDQYNKNLCTNAQFVGFVQTKCAGFCKLCEKEPYIPPCAKGGNSTVDQTSPIPTTQTTPKLTTRPANSCMVSEGEYYTEGEEWYTTGCLKKCTCVSAINNNIDCGDFSCPQWIHNCDLVDVGKCCPVLRCNYFNTIHGPGFMLGKK